MPITLVRGDITGVTADAIVNAANSQLAPGAGVCGAIHAAGGPSIAAESAEWIRTRGAVPTGGAAITGAGRLHAHFVIHAVGPIWRGGGSGEADQLRSAYRSSIELADARGLSSIAFPSISTGIYGYPVDEAAPIAVAAAEEALARAKNTRDVTFVLFDRETYEAYERALAAFG